MAPPERLPRPEAQRRRAELLRQIYEVDPLTCPRCAGSMRIVACITQRAVIDQILAHLERRAAKPCATSRAPPSTAPTARRRSRPRGTARPT